MIKHCDKPKSLHIILALLVVLTCFFETGADETFKIIGYAPEWLGLERLASETDFFLFTHLNIAFGNPDATGIIAPLAGAEAFIRQSHQSGVKVFLSLGGGETATEPSLRKIWFPLMTQSRRGKFIRSIVEYAMLYGYDGIDLDLECDAINADYDGFARELGQELRRVKLGYSAALPADAIDPDITDRTLAAFDWVNIMAYDLTGPWDPETPGQHTPYAYAESGIDLFLSRGIPKDRLVLGIPLYGWCFGPSCGKEEYPWSQIAAQWPAYINADFLKPGRDNTTVYYNGMATLQKKAALAREKTGGIMFWQIDQDTHDANSLIRAATRIITIR